MRELKIRSKSENFHSVSPSVVSRKSAFYQSDFPRVEALPYRSQTVQISDIDHVISNKL